ncbi:MAG: hypothetical protein K2X93_08885 [Candidatus Obscuribacterales bacterium]|nr:hypothetical protein [Candidatus Obscuribacterales bacterium]
MPRISCFAICLTLTALLFSACSKVAPPELAAASFNFKAKDQQPFEPGDEEAIAGSVTNKGGAFKGVIVTLSGSAISNGLVAMPIGSKSKVQNVYSTRKDFVMSTEQPSFFQLDKDTLEAKMTDLQCDGDLIEVELTVPMVTPGKGDIVLTVAPIDVPEKASKTVFPVHIYKAGGLLLGS